MTPEKKAQELVDKFLLEITGVDKYSYNIDSMNLYSAKQCALIAVDEIINNVLVGIDLAATWGDYWVKVKQEINKL